MTSYLGLTLKLFRLLSGLTQRALAERLDTTPNYLSMLESGKRQPSLDLLRLYTQTLGLNMADIWVAEEALSEMAGYIQAWLKEEANEHGME